MDPPVAAAPIAAALSRCHLRRSRPTVAQLVAYGSAVTGELDISPFTYCQPKLLDLAAADAVLVPETFAVVVGHEPPPAWILSAPQLRTSGEQWLAGLPALLAQDAAGWSFTTSASRPRQARLHLTRVKPSLRALLVHRGCDR